MNVALHSDLEKSVEELQKNSSVNHGLVTEQDVEQKCKELRILGETLTDLKSKSCNNCWDCDLSASLFISAAPSHCFYSNWKHFKKSTSIQNMLLLNVWSQLTWLEVVSPWAMSVNCHCSIYTDWYWKWPPCGIAIYTIYVCRSVVWPTKNPTLMLACYKVFVLRLILEN